MTSTKRLPLPKRRSGGGAYFSTPQDEVDFFSSGSKLLDLALGGGWAERRVSNVIGDRSTGKTLVAIEASANFIRKYSKGRIRYREGESAFNERYAAALGMPLDSVDFGEEPAETVEDLFEELEYRANNATHPEFMIIDSLDSFSTRAEMKHKIDEASYGTDKAKVMSQLFRRLINPMADRNITLMVISQIRDNIGGVFKKTKRSGGHALDFYESQEVTLAELGKVYHTAHNIKRPTGIAVLARVTKNKVGIPYRSVSFEITFGFGIDDLKSCIKFLKTSGGLGDALGVLKEQQFIAMCQAGETAGWRDLVKHLHDAVEARWWQIEKELLPTRSKYQ